MNKEVVIQSNGRLAYYKKEALSKSMWESHWNFSITKNYYRRSISGDLAFLEKPIKKYFQKGSLTLEAGCGLSKYVIALNNRGYRCEGVDYASQTISKVKSIFPDLNVRVDNLKKLSISDNYYDNLISLGVVEHEFSGPDIFLREFHRILKPNGMAYITVPYINFLKKYKLEKSFYDIKEPKDYNFYQYAFSEDEIKKIIEKNNFRVVDVFGYGAWKGIKDEISFFQKVYNIPKIGGLYAMMTKLPIIEKRFGHMIGIMCQKK
tara:strand:+ start:71 stop:859 length:789 start_codon:yes stop_codon:yes gene_type:complete